MEGQRKSAVVVRLGDGTECCCSATAAIGAVPALRQDCSGLPTLVTSGSLGAIGIRSTTAAPLKTASAVLLIRRANDTHRIAPARLSYRETSRSLKRRTRTHPVIA